VAGACVALIAIVDDLLKGRLSCVCGRRSVGLKDRAFRHAHSPICDLRDFLVGVIEEISRQILSGWVQGGKGFQIIDHLMIEIIDDRSQQMLEFFEVQEQTRLVQFYASQGDKHPVVMAMWVLTPPIVVPQIMA